MRHVLPALADHELLLSMQLYITPSNINPWRGQRRPDGFFTLAQIGLCANYELDHETCDFVVVRSPATMREYWWPPLTPNPVFLLPCPIIKSRADGDQLLVLSPAGMKKWVYADGSITKRRIGAGKTGRARA